MKVKAKCAIPDCWQEAKYSGLCSACYQWWIRISLKSPAELAVYLKRVGRMYSRARSNFSFKKRRAA